MVLRNERFNNGVLPADATSSGLLVRILLWLNLDGMLVENGPFALYLVNVLILLLAFVGDVDVITFVGCCDLL